MRLCGYVARISRLSPSCWIRKGQRAHGLRETCFACARRIHDYMNQAPIVHAVTVEENTKSRYYSQIVYHIHLYTTLNS